MDPPLEPPLRVRMTQASQTVDLASAHADLERFIDEARSGSQQASVGDEDGAGANTSTGAMNARGTSAVVLGQLQRLSDSLARETRER